MHRETIQRRRDQARPEAAAEHAVSDVQRKALRGLGYDQAVQQLAPVQREADTASVHAAAARGTAGGGGALPHLAAIQRSFGGHDVSGISAHVGGQASEACEAMGAQAYASGSSVAFGKSPDLHTAAHEAAHIVQQRAGVSLSGGVGQVGDAYERNADAVADAVVQGKSAEGLLGRTGATPAGGVQMKSAGAVQRAGARDVTVDGGIAMAVIMAVNDGGMKPEQAIIELVKMADTDPAALALSLPLSLPNLAPKDLDRLKDACTTLNLLKGHAEFASGALQKRFGITNAKKLQEAAGYVTAGIMSAYGKQHRDDKKTK